VLEITIDGFIGDALADGVSLFVKRAMQQQVNDVNYEVVISFCLFVLLAFYSLLLMLFFITCRLYFVNW
jgi:hypothetical protein